MNNKNKILIGCLALLLVLSVGYALFGETVTINGTAQAKGEFDITATCQTGVLNDIETPFINLGNTLLEENGYENDSCVVSNNVITFKSDLKYPTAARNFTIKFQNTGTIAAQMYLVKDGVATSAIDDRTYCIYDATTNEEVSCGSKINGANTYIHSTDYPVFEYADGTLITSQASLSEFLITEGQDTYFKLQPGQSAYIIYGMQWLDGSESLLEDNQYFKFNVDVELDFQQVTN